MTLQEDYDALLIDYDALVITAAASDAANVTLSEACAAYVDLINSGTGSRQQFDDAVAVIIAALKEGTVYEVHACEPPYSTVLDE
jgi:hypothetical protein